MMLRYASDPPADLRRDVRLVVAAPRKTLKLSVVCAIVTQ